MGDANGQDDDASVHLECQVLELRNRLNPFRRLPHTTLMLIDAESLEVPKTLFDYSPEADPHAVRRVLVIACVFTMVGGYTDAYSYLAHSGVFANAQTGNVVLLGVYASGGNLQAAARHVPPIAAFIAGVAVAIVSGVRPQKRDFSQTLICQVGEFLIIALLAAFGNMIPVAWIVPVLSFVAAVQNTTLNTVGAWSFNSAMTTGNLRSATSGLVLWVLRRDPSDNGGKAIALGLICFSFLTGAVAGGYCTRIDEIHALAPCAAIVAIGILLTWRERQRRLRFLERAAHASSSSRL